MLRRSLHWSVPSHQRRHYSLYQEIKSWVVESFLGYYKFGETETHYPGYLVAQDTCYIGHLKGVGFVYLQTAIDTYSKVAFAKLYVRKNAVVAADLLRDKVVPFFEENGLRVQRILTDRGTEYCGNIDRHEYQLLLTT